MTNITPFVVEALEDLKGENISCLDVRSMTDIADTIVVASGTSSRHVKSLAEHAALALKEKGFVAIGIEGLTEGEWVLVDFGDLILHVMQAPVREYYDLEALWDPSQVLEAASDNPAHSSP